VNVFERFRDPIASLDAAGYLAAKQDDLLAITRDALLRVDVLLPRFFLPEHAGIRYT
jgi:oxygen-independent coproporphyrinogen-3 oxidase